MSKRIATNDQIAIIMQWGIMDNGKITSLEVKNYLRTKGYWAEQKQVSDTMASIYNSCQENKITWDIEGKNVTLGVRVVSKGASNYREYFFIEIGKDTKEKSECNGCPLTTLCNGKQDTSASTSVLLS